MKVLLILPNKYAQRSVSVGLAMISAVLKKSGHEVVFFDTSRFSDASPKNGAQVVLERQTGKMDQVLQFVPVELDPIERSDESVADALDSVIQSFSPGLIGFGVTSIDFKHMVSLVEQIKHYQIPTIIGGSQAIVAPMETLAVDGVDMVCVSEGEEAICELADCMESGQFHTDIKNIYFKHNNDIIKNEIRPYVDLDSLPFPDLDIFDKYHHIGAYHGKQVVYGRFEAARGCPYECTYCINAKLHSIHFQEKRHVRYKSPQRIIDEMKYEVEKIGVDIIRFVDETFTVMSNDKLAKFVSLYRDEINKPMIITTRPETANYKKMKILRQAHEHLQVTMGIESGSEEIRKKVCNRHMSNETIINAFQVCRDLGYYTASFNMIGLPDETREDFLETIEINRITGVDSPTLGFFYPFHGTKLREYCLSKGYINDERYEANYGISSVLKMPQFSVEEIEGLQRTFAMYVKMDRSYLPEIREAEHDDAVFGRLSHVYNSQYLSKEKLRTLELFKTKEELLYV